ncbi:type II toxin-antitoxin system HicA family toxin [Oceanithermus sp.]
MSKKEKLLAKMRRLPPEAKFKDVETLLAMFGFTEARSNGSHHVFWHELCGRLVVPKRGGQKVKRTYIGQILQQLEDCGLIEPGE